MDLLGQVRVPDSPLTGRFGPIVVVSGPPDLAAMLGKHPTDRLDVGLVLVIVDIGHDQRCWRRSSAAKKVDAEFIFSWERFCSLLSAVNFQISSTTSVVTPNVDRHRPGPDASSAPRRDRPDTQLRRHRLHRNHSDSCLGTHTLTIQTACSRSSDSYPPSVFPAMTSTFPRIGVFGHPGTI